MGIGRCIVVLFVTDCHRQLQLSLSSPFFVAGSPLLPLLLISSAALLVDPLWPDVSPSVEISMPTLTVFDVVMRVWRFVARKPALCKLLYYKL